MSEDSLTQTVIYQLRNSGILTFTLLMNLFKTTAKTLTLTYAGPKEIHVLQFLKYLFIDDCTISQFSSLLCCPSLQDFSKNVVPFSRSRSCCSIAYDYGFASNSNRGFGAYKQQGIKHQISRHLPLVLVRFIVMVDLRLTNACKRRCSNFGRLRWWASCCRFNSCGCCCCRCGINLCL